MSEAEETTTLSGTWKNGQVILDVPADWPEGCRVVVIRECVPDFVGTTGDDQADDPESIARWIAAFDAIPPLEMTPEEEAEWQAAREAQKASEIANFEEHARRIEALFP
ncbi:MAG: hypothetical protein ACHRXM_05850 [Isosphaerales bacterium]